MGWKNCIFSTAEKYTQRLGSGFYCKNVYSVVILQQKFLQWIIVITDSSSSGKLQPIYHKS